LCLPSVLFLLHNIHYLLVVNQPLTSARELPENVLPNVI